MQMIAKHVDKYRGKTFSSNLVCVKNMTFRKSEEGGFMHIVGVGMIKIKRGKFLDDPYKHSFLYDQNIHTKKCFVIFYCKTFSEKSLNLMY